MYQSWYSPHFGCTKASHGGKYCSKACTWYNPLPGVASCGASVRNGIRRYVYFFPLLSTNTGPVTAMFKIFCSTYIEDRSKPSLYLAISCSNMSFNLVNHGTWAPDRTMESSTSSPSNQGNNCVLCTRCDVPKRMSFTAISPPAGPSMITGQIRVQRGPHCELSIRLWCASLFSGIAAGSPIASLSAFRQIQPRFWGAAAIP
mmetsp:Transcript_78692/g.218579  ORF Transcript_78692/g.218579 Transcript_78692/m.218579 type:complete len:202 (-) Transcript_78692:52-657(-)